LSFNIMAQWEMVQKTGLASTATSLNYYNGTLFCSTSGGLYYSTSNNGDDWMIYNNLTLNISDFDVTKDGFEIAVVANTANKSRIIKRNGSSWDTLFSGSTKWMHEFFEHENGGKVFWFVGGWDVDGIYRSADSGVTWTLYNTMSVIEDKPSASTIGLCKASSNRFIARKFMTLSNGLLVCAYKNVIQYSNDNGVTWHWRYGNYLLNTAQSNIGGISEREYNGKNFFFLSTDVTSGGFYRMGYSPISIDSFAYNWTATGENLPVNGGSSVSHVSAGDSLLFATGMLGLNVSYNNGLDFSTSVLDNILATNVGGELKVFGNNLYTLRSGDIYRYNLTDGISWNNAELADTSYNSINFMYNVTRYGNLYYVVLPKDSAMPNRDQIINGLTARNDIASITGNVSVSSLTNASKIISGLNSDQNYTLYSVVKSKVLTYSPITSLSFTTKSIPTQISQFKESKVNVYPNPASELLLIETNDIVNVNIVNSAGIKVKQINNVSGNITIDISTLYKGSYFVIIESPISRTIRKVLIY